MAARPIDATPPPPRDVRASLRAFQVQQAAGAAADVEHVRRWDVVQPDADDAPLEPVDVAAVGFPKRERS